MHCVGCVFAGFDTIRQALEAHEIGPDVFLERFHRVVRQDIDVRARPGPSE
jgi:hypothetical protein